MLREFEAVPVAEITGGRLHDWLASLQVGRPGRMHAPGQSTVGNFAASFAMVMDAAVKKQWMRAEDVPKITRRRFAAPVPRTWFTHAEVCQLRDHMTDEWCADAHRHRSQHLRVLLRAYVALASCTGIRPGLELELLHENQIIEERHQGNPVIRIPIRANQAKYKKAREVIVFENDAFDIRAALRALRLFRRRHELPATGLLFSCPVTGRVPGFARPFHRLLEQTGLVVDPESGLDRVPYSLRHYFATQALLRRVEDHLVARWMGTSTLMLDKYYSKVKVRMMAAHLSGTLDKPARLRAALERDIAARRLEPTIVVSPEDDDPELLDQGHQDAAGGTKAA